jgi:hypothetical protein
MSSLRDLLDVASTDGLPVSTYYGEQGAHSIYYRGEGHCKCYSDTTFSYLHHEYHWCAPSCCLEKITFEIWGGGGGGGGGCCCTAGIPGHSGQYNKFTVCASTQGVNSLDQCCYNMCIAPGTCRSPSRGGFDGCKTFILGPGLTDFCACGGCVACGGCFGGYNGCWGCSHKSVAIYTGRAAARWQSEFDNSRSNRKNCEDNGNYFWGSVEGYNQMDCCDAGDWCTIKNQFPLPAGQDSKMGSFVSVRRKCMAGCGHEEAQWVASNNGGINGDCYKNGPPGLPGKSGDAFGGGCCCGYSGSPGQVKITWYCKA